MLLLLGEIEAKRKYIHQLEDDLRSEIALRSAHENNVGTNYLVLLRSFRAASPGISSPASASGPWLDDAADEAQPIC